MATALLLEGIHPHARDVLANAGFNIRAEPGALGPAALADALRGVSLLGIRSTTQLTADVIKGADDLLAVGAFCIGTNQIDLPAANAQGVAVFNAPFSNTRSVVELAVAEIIALSRRLTDLNSGLHDGVWNKTAEGAHEVRGQTLGIVGYGNIGSQLSVVAEALGMSVVFYDSADKLALGNARRCGSLHEVLMQSDVVSLHVDGRQGNAGFFGADQFSQMREGSLFLNLSRGFVVDYSALARQVRSGHIAGAAVDVFPNEPRSPGDAFTSELQGLPNVVLTPHIGGSTQEAQADIGTFVAVKLRDFIRTGGTGMSINMPQVTPGASGARHRLAHTHLNAPGALARLNGVFADASVNIEGQMLATRGDVGYVLTDVADGFSHDVVQALQDLPETVRLRVIC